MSIYREPVVVVIPGDLHLTDPGLENHKTGLWAVEQANHSIRPDFVQFIGDNVQDATDRQFELFNELRGRLEVAHFSLAGDHDVKYQPDAKGFLKHIGKTYGSTTLHGFRFVRLNTQESRPMGLSSEQIDWFRAEVESAQALGESIVIFQHNYPYQIWENFAGTGIDEWRVIVQTSRISAILCGHTHYWQLANDGRNAHVAVRSIGDPEGGTPGYAVAYFHGDDFAVTYRTIADQGPLVLVTHPRETLLATNPSHLVSSPDQARVRVWSEAGIATVKGRIDGGSWRKLDPSEGQLWVCPIPFEQLSKGEHAFEVEVVDDDGCRGGQSISFLVDPTGRYTAVPMTRPLVERTAFC